MIARNEWALRWDTVIKVSAELLMPTLRFTTHPMIVVIVVIFILPIIVVPFSELRGKAFIKEVRTSRKIPFTHILKLSFLESSYIDNLRCGFDVGLLRWKESFKRLHVKFQKFGFWAMFVNLLLGQRFSTILDLASQFRGQCTGHPCDQGF